MKYTYKKTVRNQPGVKKQTISKKAMGTLLYHVSLEPVCHLIPRVPESRAPGEDNTRKRICLSTSIENCINAMPGSGSSLLCLRRLGITPVLFVYRVQVRWNADYLVYPHQIKHLVCDAEETKEHWLLKSPSFISRFAMKVDCFESETVTDPYGQEVCLVKNMRCSRIKHTGVSENAAALLKYFAEDPGKERMLQELIRKYDIRTVLTTMYDGLKGIKTEGGLYGEPHSMPVNRSL